MLVRMLHAVRVQPELFMEHLENYGELAAADLRTDGVRLRRIVFAALVSVAMFVVFLVLAGVAVLLWAAHQQLYWVLWAVPFAGLLCSLISFAVLRSAMEGRLLARTRDHAARDVRELANLSRAGNHA
jgi:hypothetical protein